MLREVAKHGSLSAAAVSLGYTQPAVSRQIAVLESETGVQLLRRQPQGVALTEAGRILIDRAQEIFARLERVEDELRAHTELEAGTLRISAFASAAAALLPMALVRFRERHPAVELIVTVLDPIDSLPLVRAGEMDIALCNQSDPNQSDPRGARTAPPSSWGALDAVPLFEDPMYVALPPRHPLADKPRLKLSDLAGEQWMLTTTTTCPDAELFRRACQDAKLEPVVAFQYDDYAALLGFVAASVGVSVIPDMVARNARGDVVMRELEPPLPPRPVVAAVPSGYRSPAVAAMLEVLHELAAEWQAERVTGATAQPVAA